MYTIGVFAQDDWRVAPDLVLNLGLRYNYFSNMAAHGKDGQDAAFYNPDGLLDSQFHVGRSAIPTIPTRATIG
jgi:outer membrane receptor protein involved in Fe transport